MSKLGSTGLLCAFVLAGCSAAAGADEPIGIDEADIIGGVAADSAALDAVGSLVTINRWGTTESYSPFCTATLISSRQVLSAEHCTQAVSPYQDYGFAIGSDARRPKRVVPVVAMDVERSVTGGYLNLGSDVAVLHLEKAVTDITPVKVGVLGEGDVGTRYVGVGYGVQDIQGDWQTRRAGTETLRGVTGKTLELAFGSFDGFKNAVPTIDDFRWSIGDVSTPDGEARARAIFDSMTLLDGYEVFVGFASGDAQACNGDSGGPLLRSINGERTTFGVTSWGLHRSGALCDFGAIYASFGPAAKSLIDKALTWQDPCGDLTTKGECRGTVAARCSARAEGERRPLLIDCAELGQVCGKGSDGQVACANP